MNNKLNSKNWQRVRINKSTKVLTFTNETVYKTKSECEKDIKSTQYIALNLKALNTLLNDGYSIYQANQENVTEQATESENGIIDLTGNEEIERAIKEYEQKKIESDIAKYEAKKRSQEAVKNFLKTPPKQPTYESFNYDKQMEEFITKQAPKNQKDKQRQIADYCNEEVCI